MPSILIWWSMGQHVSSWTGTPVNHMQREMQSLASTCMNCLVSDNAFRRTAYLVHVVRPSTAYKSSSKAITWHCDSLKVGLTNSVQWMTVCWRGCYMAFILMGASTAQSFCQRCHMAWHPAFILYKGCPPSNYLSQWKKNRRDLFKEILKSFATLQWQHIFCISTGTLNWK